jgi:hypothetical protein
MAAAIQLSSMRNEALGGVLLDHSSGTATLPRGALLLLVCAALLVGNGRAIGDDRTASDALDGRRGHAGAGPSELSRTASISDTLFGTQSSQAAGHERPATGRGHEPFLPGDK